MVLESWLGELYDHLNGKHFGGRLPKVKIKICEHVRAAPWNPKYEEITRAFMGTTRWNAKGKPTEIVLYKRALPTKDDWEQTLLHEMIHVEQLLEGREPKHDRKFIARAKELGLKGEIEYDG